MHNAAARGALVSVNHPKPFGPPWEYPDATGFHAVEVWNGNWQELNNVSLAWWDSLLRAGRQVVALGGSDTHMLKPEHPPDRLGRPTTWAFVPGEPSAPAVLAALRAGNSFVSRDVDGPQLYLSRHEDGVRIRCVDAQRAVLVLVSDVGTEHASAVGSDDWVHHVRVEQATRYIRAQLMDAHGQMLALSNVV
jgi:hypothetical protein